jgi:hypothetical protein
MLQLERSLMKTSRAPAQSGGLLRCLWDWHGAHDLAIRQTARNPEASFEAEEATACIERVGC